ncbi:hypothetical protein [Vitiosangium sp. GDMCC 1.1324]|uniref:hypothetical protein n=1 Tax=Vitiosangium sp. (strain GDMCC 1.1324) TaxID=2138576 RepID=UPI00130DF5E2|nr:hypothetical protein [Vitiosangium sp. GDMCC 1.1324]
MHPLYRALFVLALGSVGLEARAATAPSEASAQSPSPFVRACNALEAGNLDGAESELFTLRQLLPENPEARLLGRLVALRRTRPELGWRDAFIQAWNDIGRPDFKNSPLLEEDPEPRPTGPSPEETWERELSAEQRFVLALTMSPEATRARAIFEQFPELAPPELLVAAVEYLERDKLPAALRARSRIALRARLSALSARHPESMLLRALLLLEGTDTKAPFTPRELQELEALSQLPDWRQTAFLSLYRYALGHLEATGVSQPKDHAYGLAVSALVSPVPVLLQRRTEASRNALTPAERQRLGEALWRIGSRISDESSVVERLVGLSLMKKAATELEDSARLLQATELLEEERATYADWKSAAPNHWPVPTLRQAMIDAAMNDEMAHMHAFRAPKDSAR